MPISFCVHSLSKFGIEALLGLELKRIYILLINKLDGYVFHIERSIVDY